MLRLLNKGSGKGTGGTIRVTIPYIRQEVPIIVLFRALGLVADKDILEHIVYNLDDVEMMDLLRPSLEEASVIQSQEARCRGCHMPTHLCSLASGRQRATTASEKQRIWFWPSHLGLYHSLPAGGAGLYREARQRRRRDEREAHRLRAGHPPEGAAAARRHRGEVREGQGARGGEPSAFLPCLSPVHWPCLLPSVLSIGVRALTASRSHCSPPQAFYLGYMVHRLLMCPLGRRAQDDRCAEQNQSPFPRRTVSDSCPHNAAAALLLLTPVPLPRARSDHYGNKRCDLSGPLLASLFRQLFRRLMKDVRSYCQKCVDSGKEIKLEMAIKQNIITQGLKYSLATGNWGAQGAADVRAGVSQVLNRLTFASTLSHLRRLNSPIGRDGKLARPRQLHNSHWGMVCPAETPEGAAVGLVKNLALMAYISVGSPVGPIMEFLSEWGMETFEETHPSVIPESTKVFVNGKWLGIHRDPATLVKTLRELRRKMDVNTEVGVVHDIRLRELRLYTDYGCVRTDPPSG